MQLSLSKTARSFIRVRGVVSLLKARAEGLNMTDATASPESTEKRDKKPAPKATLKSELRFYGIFFACALTFWTVGFGHYRIPSESMQPTLEE